MPWKRADYPANWETIRACILARAGNCCEGSPAFPACRAVNHAPHPDTGSHVVLTVAHVDHDVAQTTPDNLRAWCQRCHLVHDIPQHRRNAAATRRRAREALGQLPLAFMEG